MPQRTNRPALTTEQQAEADRIRQALLAASAEDLRELAELLATTDDSTIFGATEFAVRDIVHTIGAKAIQTALDGRKKGGTTDPVEPAPTARRPPSSNANEARPS
jgi:hypothetical protein